MLTYAVLNTSRNCTCVFEGGCSPSPALHSAAGSSCPCEELCAHTHSPDTQKAMGQKYQLSTSCLGSLLCLCAAWFFCIAVKFKQGTELLKLQVSLWNKPFKDFLLFSMISIQ